MELNQFNAMLRQRMVKIDSILGSKAGEYASETDRLHNFKVAARIVGCSPEKALWMMLLKHIVSVQDMIESSDKFAAHHSSEMIDEKLGDSINYFILLEGLMKERLSQQQVEVPPAIARAASRVRGVSLVGKRSPKKGPKNAKKKVATKKRATKKPRK